MGKKKGKQKEESPPTCRKEGATSLRAIEALRMLGEDFPGTDKETTNEILVVERCAMNVGAATEPARRQIQILLTGHPHPRMNAESAWLLFHEGEDGLRDPEYLEVDRRIVIHYPISHLAAVQAILCERKRRVWCQYREYSTGHRWADIHTWPEKIGKA